MTTITKYVRGAAWLLALGAALSITACGGGGGDGGPAASLPTASTPTLSVTGPTRVVANTVLNYSASVANGTASAFNWTWGDATPSTPGAAPAKVWNRPGSFSGTVTAVVAGGNMNMPLAVTAIAPPVAASYRHSCALQTTGTVMCWGDNTFGQLGNSTTEITTRSHVVTGLNNAVGISAGDLHTCALQAAGTVRCWGKNSNGALGIAAAAAALSATSIAVPGLTDSVALSSGYNHNCALKTNGAVVCWGENSNGQLGNGTQIDSTAPVPVIGLIDVVAISANGYHSCALQALGTVRCWGLNESGQLGNGTTTRSLNPVPVTSLNNAVSIASGSGHNCAITVNGGVRCWGSAFRGSLGHGSTADTLAVVTALGITNAVAISAGGGYTCAVLSTRTVKCWGDNSEGAVGNGSATSNILTADEVSGLIDVVAISAGYAHPCALRSDGSINCWGRNTNGELGDGTAGAGNLRRVPVPAQGGSIFWK
jgi:alpha-tubulin suppressor-like RCC1 family protein